MDARSRANFINSIAQGKKLLCPNPNCNSLCEPDSFFCDVCGTELKALNVPKMLDDDVKNNDSEPVSIPETYVIDNTASGSPAFKPVNMNPSGPEMPEAYGSPAFKPVNVNPAGHDISESSPSFSGNSEKPGPAFMAVEAQPPKKEPEEVSVFAQGLPEWDMLPPQVMVRRKTK